MLVARGDLIGVGDDVYFLLDNYRDMTERIVAYLHEHVSITVVQARDLFGTPRRYIMVLLNYLDHTLTHRVVVERYLRELTRQNVVIKFQNWSKSNPPGGVYEIRCAQ